MSRGYRDGDSKRYFDWLYYAAIDLRAAKLLLSDERCYNMVAFHCQQAFEKAVKGYLLYRRHHLYDGHNLPWLCKQAMQEDEHFRDRLPLASLVNHYYIEARYPADFLLQLDEESASELIVSVNDMLTFVNSLVKFDFQSYRHKRMPT
jgi:HEPN domain-containing protein